MPQVQPRDAGACEAFHAERLPFGQIMLYVNLYKSRKTQIFRPIQEASRKSRCDLPNSLWEHSIMDQLSRVDSAVEVIEDRGAAGALGRRGTPHGPFRRFLRRFIHFFSYHLILARQSTRVTRAGGFRLIVRPTVFHPRYFLSSECFAEFISRLDLSGKRVVDIGTGSGILALAAARAGAENVTATDINANAALTAAENARANGVGGRVSGLCSNLLCGVCAPPAIRRDPIEPTQACGRTTQPRRSRLACRSKVSRHSGIVRPGAQRLKPGGRLYVMVSSDSDLDLFGSLIDEGRISRAPRSRTFDLHRVADYLRIARALGGRSQAKSEIDGGVYLFVGNSAGDRRKVSAYLHPLDSSTWTNRPVSPP